MKEAGGHIYSGRGKTPVPPPPRLLNDSPVSSLTFYKTTPNMPIEEFRAQLFEGGLALNPGLNLTRVSFSCVQKHFLR